jgi:type II secretory pathway pseudopilin PulG
MKQSRKFRLQPFSLVHNQRGVTYLLALFAIVLIGISLMVTGQHWSIIVKRDREAELLFRGTRIKEAIERYAADYEVQKATRPQRYPLKLEDLTKKPRRYLPVVYLDPITQEKFKLIKVGNEIRGVRSVSTDIPLDQVNFKGADSYYAIKFQASGTTNCEPNPQNPTLPTNCQKSTSPTGEKSEEVPPEDT